MRAKTHIKVSPTEKNSPKVSDKIAGRNTMRFFNPQMQDAINDRVAMENDLRQAVENN